MPTFGYRGPLWSTLPLNRITNQKVQREGLIGNKNINHYHASIETAVVQGPNALLHRSNQHDVSCGEKNFTIAQCIDIAFYLIESFGFPYGEIITGDSLKDLTKRNTVLKLQFCEIKRLCFADYSLKESACKRSRAMIFKR